MKLMIIAGFLGSGKTTLLLHIARRLSEASRKIAIIENEIGEIGVDGDYLKMNGLYVQELFGGCICCTLSTSLIDTLKKVKQRFKPDFVILEATGAALPGDITTNLRNYPSKVESIQVLTIVDACRFEMLMEMLGPLLTSQIQAADTVAINKIDQVEEEVLDRIIQGVGRLNAQAKVNAISAQRLTNLNTIMDDLL